jgi:hypothetical protein
MLLCWMPICRLSSSDGDHGQLHDSGAMAGALREAALSAAANPLHAFLSGLAIAAAVATIAIVVEGLDGFSRYSRLTSARAFGSDTFVVARVVSGNLSRRDLADKLARNPAIRRNDVRFLERFAEGRVVYAPLVQVAADITAGGRTTKTRRWVGRPPLSSRSGTWASRGVGSSPGVKRSGPRRWW